MAASHWVKLDRALDHIDALQESVERWIADGGYLIREEKSPYVDPDGMLIINVERVALVFRCSRPEPIDEWLGLIGDAAHNLRASLDHLAFALNAKGYADAHTGAELPADAVKASEFPVIGNVDGKGNPADGGAMYGSNRVQRKIAHVPKRARTIIKGVQPYKRGTGYVQDPLWLVHELDVIDKHRTGVIAGTAQECVDVNNIRLPPVMEAGLFGGFGGPLEDGDELMHWVPMPGTEAEYDLHFTFGVAFGKRTPIPGWPIVKTLRDLRDYIRVKVATPLDKSI